MPVSSPPSPRRAFVADTVALLLFFTATGLINERFIARMSWNQVLQARALGAMLMVPVGRPMGSGATASCDRPAGPPFALLWDSLALVSFQGPIYAAIIAVSGASRRGLLMGVLGATVMMFALGRPLVL